MKPRLRIDEHVERCTTALAARVLRRDLERYQKNLLAGAKLKLMRAALTARGRR